MSPWTPAGLPWSRFDRTLVDDELAAVVGGLALVESRADLYGDYLARVLATRFDAQPRWPARIAAWAVEERQHGEALRRWYSLARPDVDVDAALARYLGDVAYHDDSVTESVRGGVEQELVCRCLIEALATTLYQALAARAREPVLRLLLKTLAADEARHYRLFADLLAQERAAHGRHQLASARAVLLRLRALDDEQVMRAAHCASGRPGSYVAGATRARLLPRIYRSYAPAHLQALARLVGPLVGLHGVRSARLLGAAGGLLLRARAVVLGLAVEASAG
ncbi:MAG: ferritin-like domain-containing protein [Myxococcaceae bacterium]|nr:ferritin-like domain-containing protein [Myxococcaceae bacterium]MCA3012100.1 ferritin-like domain-containing protein [Myxococcaceae bacterium]